MKLNLADGKIIVFKIQNKLRSLFLTYRTMKWKVFTIYQRQNLVKKVGEKIDFLYVYVSFLFFSFLDENLIWRLYMRQEAKHQK